MKCQYCGSEIAEGTRICNVCGSPVVLSQETFYASKDASAYNQQNAPDYSAQQNYSGSQNNDFYQPQNHIQNYGQQFNQPMGGNEVQGIPNVPQGNDFNQQQMFSGVQPPLQNSFGQPLIPVQPNLTKKEFINLPNLAAVKKDIKGVAIFGYICVAATIIFNLAMSNMGGLLDAAVLLALSLGIHLKYSRGCAIALTVYSIINMIVCIVVLGSPNGWLILAVGLGAMKATSYFNKYWQSYITTGGIPPVLPKHKK